MTTHRFASAWQSHIPLYPAGKLTRFEQQALDQAKLALTLPAFKEWLEGCLPGQLVGQAQCANNCPLAAYLADLTGFEWSVFESGSVLGGISDSWPCVELPAWVLTFLHRVDDAEVPLTAARCLSLLTHSA